jgi:hypothetical protein
MVLTPYARREFHQAEQWKAVRDTIGRARSTVDRIVTGPNDGPVRIRATTEAGAPIFACRSRRRLRHRSPLFAPRDAAPIGRAARPTGPVMAHCLFRQPCRPRPRPGAAPRPSAPGVAQLRSTASSKPPERALGANETADLPPRRAPPGYPPIHSKRRRTENGKVAPCLPEIHFLQSITSQQVYLQIVQAQMRGIRLRWVDGAIGFYRALS